MKPEITNGKHPAPSRGIILVADDEEHNRTLLRDSLELHNYEIIEADSGQAVLDLVGQRPVDLILLDVMMPDMDGFEVCRRLKQDPRTAMIPILMVTALSERKERMIGIAAGANDFLTKPVDIQDLTLRVRNAIAGKRLFEQLQAEQAKSNRLLLSILPQRIAERIIKGESAIADSHPDVTVMMADLAGFTALSALIGPEQMVSLLNEIFSAFDEIVARRGIEKIKTIGDAYMVAAGLSSRDPNHAEAMAELALELRAKVEEFNRGYNTSLRIRMGISTGPVLAGVIGRDRISYDLWGDTVNLASRLEATADAGKIIVSEKTYNRLKDTFQFGNKALLNIRGHGPLNAYELTGPAALTQSKPAHAPVSEPSVLAH